MRSDLESAVATAVINAAIRRPPRPEAVDASLAVDETVIQVMFGVDRIDRAVTVVLTNRGIFWLTEGTLPRRRRDRSHGISFEEIIAIEREPVLHRDFRVTLTRPHNADQIAHLTDDESARFVSEVRNRAKTNS